MTDAFSRRRFLAAAGATAAPALWSPLAAPAASLVANADFQFDASGKADRIKTGFIGVGGRGTALLKEILKSKQAEMVAICDLRPEAIEAATALCQGMSPKGYVHYADLLADPNVEAVFIATPVDLHGEMAAAAMDADKHIYCEKPVGITGGVTSSFFQKAQRWLARQGNPPKGAPAKPRKAFQFGFQWMYNQNFRAAVESVHENMIGGVLFVHAQRHGGDLPRDKGKDWLFDRNRSGDIIVEQAVHEMNVLCWGLKSHPTKAVGMGGTNCYVNEPVGRNIMDHYSLSYEFPGPCHVSYSHLYYAHGPLGQSHIYFFGPRGAIDVMGGMVYMADGSTPAPRDTKLTKEDTFNAVYSFFEHVRTGTDPLPSPERGYLATLTCILGREAIYSQKPVTWDQALLNVALGDQGGAEGACCGGAPAKKG